MLEMIGGNRAKAEAAFKTAVFVDPKSVDAHLSLGYFYWVTGRAPAAEAEFRAALAIAPKHLNANYAMAYCTPARTLKQPAKAEPYLKAVADAAPDSTGKLAHADYYARMQRRPAETAQHIPRRAIAADGHDHLQGSAAKIEALAGLGLASKSGGPAAALKLIDEVLTKEPTNVNALIAKSEVLAGTHKLDEALAAAQAAVHADPRSPGAQYELGVIEAARRQDDDAISAFQVALKLNPQMASADDQLAGLYLAAGRLDSAQQFARDAISAVPGFVDPHVVLARINVMKGNVAAAEIRRFGPSTGRCRTYRRYRACWARSNCWSITGPRPVRRSRRPSPRTPQPSMPSRDFSRWTSRTSARTPRRHASLPW